jgi:hypothetical protein
MVRAMKDWLLQYVSTHPVAAGVIAVAVLAGRYLLLNRKPKATREAERRVAALREQGRDLYRGQRPLK